MALPELLPVAVRELLGVTVGEGVVVIEVGRLGDAVQARGHASAGIQTGLQNGNWVYQGLSCHLYGGLVCPCFSPK